MHGEREGCAWQYIKEKKHHKPWKLYWQQLASKRNILKSTHAMSPREMKMMATPAQVAGNDEHN
jgi:hypothetical protein